MCIIYSIFLKLTSWLQLRLLNLNIIETMILWKIIWLKKLNMYLQYKPHTYELNPHIMYQITYASTVRLYSTH